MQIQMTIETTDQIVDLDGVPVRVWKGVTASGIECLVFVHRIAVHQSNDQKQFEKELLEQSPPAFLGRDFPP